MSKKPNIPDEEPIAEESIIDEESGAPVLELPAPQGATVQTITSLDQLEAANNPAVQSIPSAIIEEIEKIEVWERQSSEPELWYDRFVLYRRLGPMRTINMAMIQYREIQAKEKGETAIKWKWGTSTSWLDAAKKYQWQARALAYDDMVARREEAEWFKRRSEFRDKEYSLAESLIKKAEEMLKFPLATVVRRVSGPDGADSITEIKPARWDFGTVAEYVDLASKIARLAAELEQSRGNGNGGQTIINQTFTTIRVRDLVKRSEPTPPPLKDVSPTETPPGVESTRA